MTIPPLTDLPYKRRGRIGQVTYEADGPLLRKTRHLPGACVPAVFFFATVCRVIVE